MAQLGDRYGGLHPRETNLRHIRRAGILFADLSRNVPKGRTVRSLSPRPVQLIASQPIESKTRWSEAAEGHDDPTSAIFSCCCQLDLE